MENADADIKKHLSELGFDNEHEYRLYVQMKESLKQKIVVGIAS